MGLYAKMAAIMGAIDKVDKDKEMQSGPRYKYVTDVQVYHTVRKLLIEHSIALFASMTDVEQTRIVTSVDDKGNERDKFHTRARFEFVLVDSESGEQMTCTWYGESQDVGDKGVNKCATAALKYWLLKTFIIPTGDDPDDTASGTVGRTVNAKTGEVTRSEAQPTTRAQRSTQETGAPHGDELPPAAQEMAQELPLGTPRPEDVWVLSKTLYTKTAATMPKGVNWGFQVYEGAKKLGYADEEAVRAVVGVKSLNDWDKTLGELLNTLIDNAPTLAEAA